MKIKFTSLLAFFQLAIFFFLTFNVYAQETILWNYPLKPGMEEWATLRTKQQMDSAELEELRIIALDKYENKLQNPEVYSVLFNIKKTMLLIASIIDRQNNEALSPEQQEILKTFIENYNHCPNSLLTEVSKIITL